MLVRDIIDRTFSQWLYPSGVNHPAYDILSSAINDSTLTIPLEGRIPAIPGNAILEIDSELILLEDVVGGVHANERGYLDSGPATHTIGTRVAVNPEFSRLLVFNTLCDLIGDLYGAGVYQRVLDDTLTYTACDTIELPVGTLQLLKATVMLTGLGVSLPRTLRPERGQYEVYTEFDPPLMRCYGGGSEGCQLVVAVAQDFVKPTAETDDLSTVCLLPSALIPHLPAGIAGTIMQSREIPRAVIEEIKRLLAVQGVQVGTALNVGTALLNLYARYVDAERRRLEQLDPTQVQLTH